MEDMLKLDNLITENEADELAHSQKTANSLGKLLQNHNGDKVSVMDLRGINNWTDFFVIATVTSKMHMEGMKKHIKEFCHENNLDINGHSRKNTDAEWCLIDLGWAVIHLMSKNAREFYDLERLWRQMST
jgi:ribosome-associated protein